jgi:hypothetical protein
MNGNILDKLEKLKKNDKKTFQNIQLNEEQLRFLLDQTFFIKTNKVIVKYKIVKNFANSSNFKYIIENLIIKIKYLISKYDNFEIHIDLEGYTLTSHERIKNIYSLLFQSCEKDNILFSEKLIKLHIYNCPIFIRSLSSFFAPFINKTANEKIFLFNKIDSKKMLLEILE